MADRRTALRRFVMALLVAVNLVLPVAARADEGPKPAPVPSASPTPPPAAKPPENPPVTGRLYLQGGYSYNLAGPRAVNDFHLFDVRSNAMTLQIFQLLVEKGTSASHPFGFRVNAMYGEEARYLHAAGLGSPNSPVDLTEAFVSFRAPLGSGLHIDIGKFLGPCGLEYNYAIDNTTWSNSFLSNYAVPGTHTGLRMRYDFSERFNATFLAVEGWDALRDTNDSQSYGLSLWYAPSDAANFTLSAIDGAELPHDAASTRFLVDFIGAFKPAKDWLVLTNYDYGCQKHASGTTEATWNGAELVVQRRFTDRFALAVRAEYFADPQGYRTGVAQTLRSFTLTPEIKLPGDIILRPEYRHDWSNVPAFNNGTRRSQDVLGIGVMYQYPFSF